MSSCPAGSPTPLPSWATATATAIATTASLAITVLLTWDTFPLLLFVNLKGFLSYSLYSAIAIFGTLWPRTCRLSISLTTTDYQRLEALIFIDTSGASLGAGASAAVGPTLVAPFRWANATLVPGRKGATS